ncbi:hypothetical protein Q5P01_003795 [Channa striata]|uniref:Uncharacterized protein n=1 Tax=Channa striata TaxID=64152 RepID=A0AA88NT49_CHASR|nr:hypothetical protein Q5P01_003795 [Channa striata]
MKGRRIHGAGTHDRHVTACSPRGGGDRRPLPPHGPRLTRLRTRCVPACGGWNHHVLLLLTFIKAEVASVKPHVSGSPLGLTDTRSLFLSGISR